MLLNIKNIFEKKNYFEYYKIINYFNIQRNYFYVKRTYNSGYNLLNLVEKHNHKFSK